MSKIKLVIGGDHAGYEYKEMIEALLIEKGYEVTDFGTNSLDSCDYPDFVHPVAESIENKTAKLGFLVCGSGNGVSMTANKHKDVRAALCWNKELAELARLHNDANILSIPSRFVSVEDAKAMVLAFLETDFEGGRHQKRVDKINL